VSRNNLTIIQQLRCNAKERGVECQAEIREIKPDARYGMPVRRYEHIGEPCRRYYGKDPEVTEGFPVDSPNPIRRCAACWPHPDGTVGDKGDPVGVVTTRQEAWGDRTVCSSCDRENYYSIGD